MYMDPIWNIEMNSRVIYQVDRHGDHLNVFKYYLKVSYYRFNIPRVWWNGSYKVKSQIWVAHGDAGKLKVKDNECVSCQIDNRQSLDSFGFSSIRMSLAILGMRKGIRFRDLLAQQWRMTCRIGRGATMLRAVPLPNMIHFACSFLSETFKDDIVIVNWTRALINSILSIGISGTK